jgi:glyoxalase family protein
VTSFLIPENAIEFWRARLKSSNVPVTEGIRFDERYLSFPDPDGLEVEMVESPLANSRTFWTRGPVAPEFATRGFRGVTLLEELHEKTAALLTEELGFARLQEDGNRIRYQVGAENSLAVVDVVGLRGEGRGQIAVGSIHHLAWRVRDEYQLEWKEKLTNLGHYLSPVMDRRYFRSIYFREPGGVLFEIATDGPGFVVDEPIEELGRSLSLPPWLESMRGELERRLAPVQIRDFHS